MPYYAWSAVNIYGELKKGKQSAPSWQHLDKILFERQLALIRYRQTRIPFKYARITIADKLQFFSQLEVLMSAGVLLPEALDILALQISHPKFQGLLYQLAQQVHAGHALSKAMRKYPLFDTMDIQLLTSGEESGNILISLGILSTYLRAKQEFRAQIKAALLMPAITAFFFVLVFFFMMYVILPRFATLFASLNQQLPLLTQYILHISGFFSGWKMLVIAATTAILTIIGAFYFRTMRGKQVRTQLLFCLPFISTIMRDYSAARFFISLSLLTKGGVQLVPALHLIYTAEPYFLVRQMWQNVYNDVFEGIALSDALYADAKESCLPETISILKVGESSGRLSEMLEVVAHIHHNRVKQKLYAFITFLQPALLLILGLFIALLIFAIYMPIFNLSIGLS